MKEKAKPSSNQSTNDVEKTIWKDPRFAHLVSDPRFKNIHKETKSIKIDKRFKSMFNDDKFKVKYSVDKYGRRVNKTSADDLEKYYELSTDEEDVEEEQKKEEVELLKEGGDINEKVESDTEIDENVKSKLKDLSVDYARGEIPLMSDSSSDDEDSEDDDNELFIEHVWGELDNDAPTTEESSRRLAVCNMDWDRIRASDIMVLCRSFLPPGGSILSVTIYPSEYGKHRLAEEEIKGPQELTEAMENAESEDDRADSIEGIDGENKEEGDDYHMEKLRQYQLNRLKYYYAVIECNSVRAADKLYAECDGLEYESTATKLDLRFIPDEMTFDDEPKDVCTELPDLHKYKPRLFTTTALQQAKVELTWDENDVERKEINEKMITGKLNEVPDSELRKFVACSSEDDSDGNENEKQNNEDKDGDEGENKVASSGSEADVEIDSKKKRKKSKEDNAIEKYRNLLRDIDEREKEKKKNDIEMEFSWGVNINEKKEKKSKTTNDVTEELTPFEKIIEKKREKKKARKEQIRKMKKDAKKESGDYESDDSDDLPDGIDMNDPYFAEEFASGEFEKPKSKKGKKKSKRAEAEGEDEEEAVKDLELLLDDDDGKAHFSLRKIQEAENETKSKKKRKKLLNKKKNVKETKSFEDDFEIDVNDSRFSALFKSHLYNIDPTDPHFKKTKNMEKFVHEKLKRKPIENVPDENNAKKTKRSVDDTVLVKSIKRKVKGN